MGRFGRIGVLLGGATVAVGIMRHRIHASGSHVADGGVLVDDARAYDRMTRWLLWPFFARVAAEVAAVAADGARVLDVGCGPGHLALALTGRHGFDVTGVDLDPRMIGRARANAHVAHADGDAPRPTFVVGDVASLPLPDASFDVVVSTLAMHHWTDPARALAEIGRVLRRDGVALVWDLRGHVAPRHQSVPDPIEHARGSGLRVVSATPWRWPWRFALTTRFEMAPVER